MTHIAKPAFHHPNLPVNGCGLTRRDYEGVVSTLCAGCGHDSVTAAVVEACFQLDIEAHRVAKVSGIGCSSKTTNYFLNRSHGFNSVHGRMPSVATGANLANRDLVYIGVSGDGDTASIGLGQFCHAIRRQLNMTYLVENNGTYGQTKGQASATNDRQSKNKKAQLNDFESIDLAAMSIHQGAGFVARSFSGDKTQLVPLLKAAIHYRGFALIDVISPCVTFNNHDGSTKSYDYVRDHNATLDRVDFVPPKQAIALQMGAGETADVPMHDGSLLRLHKLADHYDPSDRATALSALQAHRAAGEVATGLLYLDAEETDLHDIIDTVDAPLNTLGEEDLCPGNAALQAINARHS